MNDLIQKLMNEKLKLIHVLQFYAISDIGDGGKMARDVLKEIDRPERAPEPVSSP